MAEFTYLDGLNEIIQQVCDLAAENAHYRHYSRDYMDEVLKLDCLAWKLGIARGFAGLRRFEIENEIEILEAAMLKAFINDESNIPWLVRQRIKACNYIRWVIIESLKRNVL